MGVKPLIAWRSPLPKIQSVRGSNFPAILRSRRDGSLQKRLPQGDALYYSPGGPPPAPRVSDASKSLVSSGLVILFSSLNQRPRSIKRHLSEQNGPNAAENHRPARRHDGQETTGLFLDEFMAESRTATAHGRIPVFFVEVRRSSASGQGLRTVVDQFGQPWRRTHRFRAKARNSLSAGAATA